MDGVITGAKERPRRVVVYGPWGIGKTDFACSAPDPIVIQTELGCDDNGAARFPVCATLDEFYARLKQVAEDKHKHRTLVIDSGDFLEKLIHKYVVDNYSKKVESIAEIEYGQGYELALTHWCNVIDCFDSIMDTRDMNVVVCCQARIQDYNDPRSSSYDRYVPALHVNKKGYGAGSLIQQWADEVLCVTWQVFTKVQDTKFGGERVVGTGTGQRMIYTEERPAWLAKNRLGLPPEMPFNKGEGWSEYEQYWPKNKKETVATNKKEVK